MVCAIKYLNQFGGFLAMVIGFSLLLSSTMFPAILASCGYLGVEERVWWKMTRACGCGRAKTIPAKFSAADKDKSGAANGEERGVELSASTKHPELLSKLAEKASRRNGGGASSAGPEDRSPAKVLEL